MKNLRSILIGMVCLLGTGIMTFAQNNKGQLVDDEGRPIPYVNIVLLSMPDSAFVSGTMSDEKGMFELPQGRNDLIVRFSSVGYLPLCKNSRDTDFSVVRLLPDKDQYKLDEVVVTARMPMVKNKGSKSTIRVQNTMLSQLGDASMMLANTPGLHKGQNGIEVNGLGEPIYIVDGREVNMKESVLLLRADQIKEIEIDRTPSIEYSSTGRPLVKITTVKSVHDHLFLALGNAINIKRRFSEAAILDAKAKLKQFSTGVSYKTGKTAYTNKESYFRHIYHPTYTFSSVQERRAPNEDKPHLLNWNGDFNLNKYHRLGFEYAYRYENSEGFEIGQDRLQDEKGMQTKDVHIREDNLSKLHDVVFIYNYKKENTTFLFSQDFAQSRSRKDYTTRETQDNETKQITTASKDKYKLAITNIRYTTRLPWKIGVSTGIKYNWVQSEGTTHSDDLTLMGNKYRVETDVTEHNPQAYLSLSRRFGKVVVKPALRYQYVYRELKSVSANQPERVKQDYSSWFPSFSLTYDPNDQTSLYLRYNRSIMQPKFSEINSGVIYLDSLNYSEGNADLKASFTHNLNLGGSWKDFSFGLSYMYEKNPFEWGVDTPVKPGSNIVISRTINLKSQKEFSVDMGYSNSFSRFQFYVNGAVVFPYSEYYFLDKLHKANKVSLNGDANLSYTVSRSIGVFTSFHYQGRRTALLLSQRSVNNWSVGMTGSFLKNRLKINATFTDILQGANYNNLITRYGQVDRGTFGTNDARGFQLKVSYTVFTKPIKVKSKNDNSEMINRIQ